MADIETAACPLLTQEKSAPRRKNLMYGWRPCLARVGFVCGPSRGWGCPFPFGAGHKKKCPFRGEWTLNRCPAEQCFEFCFSHVSIAKMGGVFGTCKLFVDFFVWCVFFVGCIFFVGSGKWWWVWGIYIMYRGLECFYTGG